jgi:hypothetical protein
MDRITKASARAVFERLSSVDIFWVSLLVVGVYYLPLLVALAAAVGTNFYTVEADPSAVGVPRLLDFFQTFARDSLATLFVPLITTYTILRADVSGKVPIRAFVLMAIFLAAFLLAMYLYVKIDPSLLERHRIPDLSGTLKSYAKESLTFVALVLGGTAKRT